MKIKLKNPLFSIGETLYLVEVTHSNILLNRKEHRIIDGKDWFRYIQPKYNASLSEVVVQDIMVEAEGLLSKGLSCDYGYDIDRAAFLYESQICDYTSEISIHNTVVFTNRKKAEEYLEDLTEFIRKLDFN